MLKNRYKRNNYSHIGIKNIFHILCKKKYFVEMLFNKIYYIPKIKISVKIVISERFNKKVSVLPAETFFMFENHLTWK